MVQAGPGYDRQQGGDEEADQGGQGAVPNGLPYHRQQSQHTLQVCLCLADSAAVVYQAS